MEGRRGFSIGGGVNTHMTQLLTWLTSRISLEGEEGQTAVEYALVVALVAIVLAGLLAAGATDFFGNFWDTVSGALGA